MTSLETAQQACNAINSVQEAFATYQAECHPERPPEFFSLELCGEAGELANLEKKKWKGQTISHLALSEEASDVLIALINYCNSRNINLSNAVKHKLSVIDNKRNQNDTQI